jgi:hypothetical protein
MKIKMEYNKEHAWKMVDYFGASLASLTELLDRYGYTLITCNLSGVNAFFCKQRGSIQIHNLSTTGIVPVNIQHMPKGHP